MMDFEMEGFVAENVMSGYSPETELTWGGKMKSRLAPASLSYSSPTVGSPLGPIHA